MGKDGSIFKRGDLLIYGNKEYQHIWQGYKTFAATAFVQRSGSQLVGLAEMAPKNETTAEMFWRRGESVLEHCAKTVYLFLALRSHFPDIFDTMNILGGKEKTDVWTLAVTMLLHDVGELAVGDIPDDGNVGHDHKDGLEREFFEKKMTQAFSWRDFWYLVAAYDGFQKHETFVWQVLYSLDKLEAVLQLLLLETVEAYGLNTAKPLPTMQDTHYVMVTGTPCATDCWAAHTKDRLKVFPVEASQYAFGIFARGCDGRAWRVV